MTQKETAELFGLYAIAYPHAKVFQTGNDELMRATLELWANCTAGIDYWTAMQAARRLIKTSKFIPTVAELLDEVRNIQREIDGMIDLDVNTLELLLSVHEPGETYKMLQDGSLAKNAIDAIGGVAAAGKGGWDWVQFRKAYLSAMRRQGQLPERKGKTVKRLEAGAQP